MKLRRGQGWLVVLSCLIIAVIAWAGLTPITVGSHDEVFEIPKGTWARRMAGDKIEILPSQIHLTLGINDVLVLKNQDDVPQTFGPILMMPGQSFRMPFEMASDYQFACTAHASGQMTIIVEPNPNTIWLRLRWRMNTLLRSGRWA